MQQTTHSRFDSKTQACLSRGLVITDTQKHGYVLVTHGKFDNVLRYIGDSEYYSPTT